MIADPKHYMSYVEPRDLQVLVRMTLLLCMSLLRYSYISYISHIDHCQFLRFMGASWHSLNKVLILGENAACPTSIEYTIFL